MPRRTFSPTEGTLVATITDERGARNAGILFEKIRGDRTNREFDRMMRGNRGVL